MVKEKTQPNKEVEREYQSELLKRLIDLEIRLGIVQNKLAVAEDNIFFLLDEHDKTSSETVQNPVQTMKVSPIEEEKE